MSFLIRVFIIFLFVCMFFVIRGLLHSPYGYMLIGYVQKGMRPIASSCSGFEIYNALVSGGKEASVVYYVEHGALRYFFVDRRDGDVNSEYFILSDDFINLNFPVYRQRFEDETGLIRFFFEGHVLTIADSFTDDEFLLDFISGYRRCGLDVSF